MRVNWLKGAAIVVWLCSGLAPASAQSCDNAMRFELLPNGDISAEGRICIDTAEDFRSFLRIHRRLGHEWPATLRLASPGGVVWSSVEFGTLLRQHRLNVEVSGVCASACAYAAMGGVQRRLGPSGLVGVHQFFGRDGRDASGIEANTQHLASILIQYSADMGIDPYIIAVALSTPPSGMTFLPPERLRAFGFLNDVPPPPQPAAPMPPQVSAAPFSPPPQAAPQPAANPPTQQGGPFIPISGVWRLNESTLYLVTEGDAHRFYYDEPRGNLRGFGVTPGTLLLSGRQSGQRFEGTAYTFSRNCGALAFRVSGSFDVDGRALVAEGDAPFVNPDCRVVERRYRRIELMRER